MNKDDKIYIRLEISRDPMSGELIILTRFDPNAPNFSKDKDSYFWIPTLEERDFINEAFELIPTNDIKSLSPEKPMVKPPEEEKLAVPKPQFDIEDKKPEKKFSPFGKKEEKKKEEEKLADSPSSEKTEDKTVFEVTEETKPEDVGTTTKEEDKRVFVKADESAIEAALKKHDDEDKTLIEADEKTIIEKVLSQKKKGRWIKEH